MKFENLQACLNYWEDDVDPLNASEFEILHNIVSDDSADAEELASSREYFSVKIQEDLLGVPASKISCVCGENSGFQLLAEFIQKNARHLKTVDGQFYDRVDFGIMGGIRFTINVLDGIPGIYVISVDVAKLVGMV